MSQAHNTGSNGGAAQPLTIAWAMQTLIVNS
jgi:hypothetical protein